MVVKRDRIKDFLDPINEVFDPELRKSREAKELRLQEEQNRALRSIPQVEAAPANQPRLSTGEVNPNYEPTSIRDPGKLTAPQSQNVRSGASDTFRALQEAGINQTNPNLALEAQAQAIQGAQARAEQITSAFNAALGTTYPSFFNPSKLGANIPGLFGASAEGALTGGALAGGAALLGVGAATGGAAIAVVGGAAVLSGLRSALKEYQGQKVDSITAASAKYDEGLRLQQKLINEAKKGSDPNFLIESYVLLEQDKRLARQILEYKSANDPTDRGDKARAKLNDIYRNEARSIKIVREQAFLDSLVNPTRLRESAPSESLETP